MTQLTNQTQFTDNQGQKLSFDSILSTDIGHQELIPHSKTQLINTLLHRLERQNEFLVLQKKNKGYLGEHISNDELDELDELIALMVNEVDFSNLSVEAKDKLINSLLRRVKKHHALIDKIKQHNISELQRLQAVEMDELGLHDVSDIVSDVAQQELIENPPEVTMPKATPDQTLSVVDEIALDQSREQAKPEVLIPVESAQAEPSVALQKQAPKPEQAVFVDTPSKAEIAPEIKVERRNSDSKLRTKNLHTGLATDSQAQTVAVEIHPELAQNKVHVVTASNDTFPAYIPDYDDLEDDEDDEEDETRFLFALKEFYQSSSQESIGGRSVIEVLLMRGDDVQDVQYILPGQKHHIVLGHKRLKLVQNTNSGQFFFFYKPSLFKGLLVQGDKQQNLGQNEPSKAKKLQVPLKGEIHLTAGNVTYVLRRIAPITSPEVTVETQTKKPIYQSLIGSTLFHILVLLIASVFLSFNLNLNKDPQPQFVKVDINNLQPKKEPPKVVVPKPKTPKPKVKKVAKTKPKAKPTPKPRVIKNKPKNKKTGSTAKTDVKKTGLLASLGHSKGKKSNSKQAIAQVTSLNAVSSLNSQAGKMKVGGLSAKVANSRVSIPSGPAVNSKGSMVSGKGRGNVAALNRGSVANGKVRGKVKATLSKKVKIGGGLSRQAVKKVIDAHMSQVTYCYEKSLVGNPNLSGKAVFEWKILKNGSVGKVGIQSSSLRSNKLHRCIKGAIKGWKFPQPKGVDSTTVSYPFIFDMVGF